MASLFGSVATEVGGTVKDLAQQKREDRIADEEHQRTVQLQKQRLKHDSDQTDRRISADDRRETRRQEYETSMYEMETERRETEAAAEREHETGIEQERTRRDIITEAMKQYSTELNKGTMKGNGFTVEFGKDTQVYDPASNSFVLQEGLTKATAPDNSTWVFRGDKAFRTNSPNQTGYDFGGDVGKQRATEEALFNGEMTMQEFSDAYGYVPTDYITGKVGRDDISFMQWAEERRLPINMFSPNDRRTSPGGGGTKAAPGTSRESREIRDRMENPQSYEGGPEMRPSIEELSAGPARDAHIAAQGGKTNAEIAAEMRAEAQGGSLAQAQALEQGGQLEQSAASGSELDEAGAVSIAEGVSRGMSSEAADLVEQGTRYELGGTL